MGKTSYDSLLVDLLKRTGHGLTMDLNYTRSRQTGDTYTAEQEDNGYYTTVQDFANLSQAAHTVTNYDLANIVKGYALYQLPFGKRRRWLSGRSRYFNGLVGNWMLGGLVLYYTGQPFIASVNNIYYPLWGDFYPNYFLAGFTGPTNPKSFQEPTTANPNPPATFYMPATIATSPIPANTTTGTVKLGTGPAEISSLRCPGMANENASVLKEFPMGADGRFNLQFRLEFYNLFNRHTYEINGCGGSGTQIGASNFAQVTGVNSNPRNGQFAVRFTF